MILFPDFGGDIKKTASFVFSVEKKAQIQKK